MSLATTSKTGFFQALRITRRDLRVFALSTLFFSSVAVGAVTIGDAHAASANADGICSAAKFFR